MSSPESGRERPITDALLDVVREALPDVAVYDGNPPATRTVRRRLRACTEAWPDCEEGAYNPACCRFPKSCSCTIYGDEQVTDADHEPIVKSELITSLPEGVTARYSSMQELLSAHNEAQRAMDDGGG